VVSTIALSRLHGNLIWAGSDTGLIHITRDGGKTWKDVTPKGVTDWSRISLIEASHFDPGEAYAAVDRHRLDDRQPYLYRTRDYGVSWQLITEGIPAPSFLRTVRQDSQNRSLLFAGTELGIYVSFDDGDHWQSLQLNLPATSVEDLNVHGDDLVIATHGRSFWILDDITPLRQVNKATEAAGTVLYSPATAVRVDNDWFLGTPVPPEEPAAANPPNGAIVDYYLQSAANHIKLEIFDAKGELVCAFSSDDHREAKHRPVPIAERWLPQPPVLDLTTGMHRFVWDLAWGTNARAEDPGGDDEYGPPRGPRVVPGTYRVRLTVDGKAFAESLEVIMDPRAVATSSELAEQEKIGRQMFAETIRSRQVLGEIHSVQKRLSALQEKVNGQQPQVRVSVAQIQDAVQKIVNGVGARSGDGMGLERASAGIVAALRVVKSGNRTIPAQAITVFEESDRAVKLRSDEWNHLKTTLLVQLNDQLKQTNDTPIPIGEVELDH
jgi:hypothetical protein